MNKISLVNPIGEAKRILNMHFHNRNFEWTVRKFTERMYASSSSAFFASKPYVLFYLHGEDEFYDFFAVVSSKLLKTSLVLISKELVDQVRIQELFLPGVIEVVNPLFFPKEELIHMLYFLVRFGTQDHSIVYRDRTFLLEKPELEHALWFSWQSRLVQKQGLVIPRIENRSPNQVNESRVRSLLATETEVSNSKWGTLVIVKSVDNIHISLYHASEQITLDFETKPSDVISCLRQWYSGSYGNAWFPFVTISKQDLVERILGVRETLSRHIWLHLFQFPYKSPNIRPFLRGRIDPSLRSYLEGKRDILCDPPAYSEEIVEMIRPFQAMYIYDTEEFDSFPLECSMEHEPHLQVRMVSVLHGLFSHLLPKLFFFLCTYEGNLQKTIEQLGNEQDVTNDSLFLFCIFRHMYMFDGNIPMDSLPAWVQTLDTGSQTNAAFSGLVGKRIETNRGAFIVVDVLKNEYKEDPSLCIVYTNREHWVSWDSVFPEKFWRGGKKELEGWRSLLEIGETIYSKDIQSYGTLHSLTVQVEFLVYRIVHITNHETKKWTIDSRQYTKMVQSKKIIVELEFES